MPFFERDSLSLHYEVHGSGRPVVMLHGVTVNFEMNYGRFGWIDVLNEAGFQVIGMDLLGHGQSDRPHDSAFYSADALMGDVIALLDLLGHDTAYLVGYSLGGILALHLLINQAHRFPAGCLMAIGDGLIGVSERSPKVIGAELIGALGRDAYPADLPKHAAAYWKFCDEAGGDRQAAIAAVSGYFPRLQVAALAGIPAPTLVISGGKDLVVGTASHLAQKIASSTYIEVAEADHFSLAVLDEVKEAAVQFLSAH